MSDQYTGVRVHYVAHGDHTVATCVYKTTEENKRACFEAIAALEGVTYNQLMSIIAHDETIRDYLKVEIYHAN